MDNDDREKETEIEQENRPETEQEKKDREDREQKIEPGWFDATMNAKTWFSMPNVKPEDAAMLLCRLNPISREDPETVFVDGDRNSPESYRVMLKVFEANRSPSPRCLQDWIEIVKTAQISVHPWVECC